MLAGLINYKGKIWASESETLKRASNAPIECMINQSGGGLIHNRVFGVAGRANGLAIKDRGALEEALDILSLRHKQTS